VKFFKNLLFVEIAAILMIPEMTIGQKTGNFVKPAKIWALRSPAPDAAGKGLFNVGWMCQIGSQCQQKIYGENSYGQRKS
jgi:hypothetical protein